MQSWNLEIKNPMVLTLAADSRSSKTDYANDQIWEICLGQGDPPALAIETTFGLRARRLRIFPRFIHNDTVIVDPLSFHSPPHLQVFFPDYIKLIFSPLNGIDVIAEYWVPGSQVIAGRFQITNNQVLSESLRFEWTGQLYSLGEGQGMAVVSMNTVYALQGKTTGLFPVCFMSGGPVPGSGPYPALVNELNLFPGNTRQFNWAMASAASSEESFELARSTANRNWDAEISKIELLNESNSLQIHTGDPDWDGAFALTQMVANSLIIPGNKNLPNPSFVLSRQPDQGYSPRGDGSDYPYLWNGQSALDTYYLSSLVLPAEIDLVEGFLRNFLSIQESDGYIDWKPGLAGQRSRRLAQPVLATLAWQVSKYKEDQNWLSEIYPGLLKFIQLWFTKDHDRDEDGYPEWDHPVQTGFEDAPIYDRWQPKSQGVDIAMLESPSLAAFLYKECTSLISIAKCIGQGEAVRWLEEHANLLKQSIEKSYDQKSSRYQYRDFQNHESAPGELIASFSNSGRIQINKKFSRPHRLLVHLSLQDETTRPLLFIINGYSSGKRTSEKLNTRSFIWANGLARGTTSSLFSSIQSIEISGLTAEDSGHIATIDYTQSDLSLLLPLWAEIPDPDAAMDIIDHCLAPEYLQPFGLMNFPVLQPTIDQSPGGQTRMIWNHLIGEGLVNYRRIDLATELVKRAMAAIIASLKQHHAFYELYNSINGAPTGEQNHLGGLAPVGLFLLTIGVQKITNNEIILYGNNQFPWPVTLKYHGLSITCNAEDTVIGFPDGQTLVVTSPGPHRIIC